MDSGGARSLGGGRSRDDGRGSGRRAMPRRWRSTIRESPVVAVAELIIRITPGPLAERLIRFVGQLRQAAADPRHPASSCWRWARSPGCSPGTASSSRCWSGSSWPSSAAVAVMVQPGARAVDVLPVVVGLRDLGGRPVGADRARSSPRGHHPELGVARAAACFLMVAGRPRPRPRSASPAPAGSWAAVAGTSPRAAGCCGSTASPGRWRPPARRSA